MKNYYLDLIPIGERIRDLVYDKNNTVIMFLGICQHWNFVIKIGAIFL